MSVPAVMRMVDPPGYDPQWDPAAQIPHFIVDSLDELQGPATGRLFLPVTVYWGPRKPEGFDLGREPEVVLAYSEAITNATPDVLRKSVNKDLLKRYWRMLLLEEDFVRDPWEARFPELKERP